MEGFESGKTEGATITTKTNKILHMCTGKGSRQAANKNKTKNSTRHQLYKLLTELE